MPFWEEKSLEQLNDKEWEALCDGCGRCCLIKLEDEDTGEIFTSDVHCNLFDSATCACGDYKNRQAKVPDCIKLTPQNVTELKWIPTTCAYRRIAEGKGLAWWHPLVCGNTEEIEKVGVSVYGRTFAEQDIKPEQWVEHAADWPNWDPDETS